LDPELEQEEPTGSIRLICPLWKVREDKGVYGPREEETDERPLGVVGVVAGVLEAVFVRGNTAQGVLEAVFTRGNMA
jgi:hypothetical protein